MAGIYKKREDGRKFDELRPIKAEVGIIPNADGSARFSFGNTIAIATVYGPKRLHPQHMQNSQKGILRCNYSMVSFSVTDRIRPGKSRRGDEISKVTEWALDSVIDLKKFPTSVVDVHILVEQADASTRCAGINAAAMALAQAGIPMKDMITSVSVGKMDQTVVLDLDKYEDSDFHDGEGSTDIAMSMTSNGKEISHMQLDGKIGPDQLKEAIELAKKAVDKIHKVQVEALKNPGKEVKG